MDLFARRLRELNVDGCATHTILVGFPPYQHDRLQDICFNDTRNRKNKQNTYDLTAHHKIITKQGVLTLTRVRKKLMSTVQPGLKTSSQSLLEPRRLSPHTTANYPSEKYANAGKSTTTK